MSVRVTGADFPNSGLGMLKEQYLGSRREEASSAGRGFGSSLGGDGEPLVMCDLLSR